MSRMVGVFGQFGIAADPVNFPHFVERVAQDGIETILVQHTDTQKAYDFLKGYNGKCALVGASLGAMSVCVFAGYLMGKTVDFVGGFQPSDWDPTGHDVDIQQPNDVITRAVTVPRNVLRALCFRNPAIWITGGLGHATYVLPQHSTTGLEVIPRFDAHPGDFGEAQDVMVARVVEALK